MLTLLETTQAIKALETEPSIILSACHNIIHRDEENKSNLPEDIAKEIYDTFIDRVGPGEFLRTLCICIGVTAVVQAKEGKEAELLTRICEKIAKEMARASVAKLEREMEEGPAKGLMKMLDMLGKAMGG